MKSKLVFLLIFLITIAFSGPAFSATYTYDDANRLTRIDHGNGTVVDYTYDANGNMVSMSVNDTLPPIGSISLNNGAVSTTSTSVTLNLFATDNSGAVSQMSFSNDNTAWSAWEPYATSKAWTLSAGDGNKTVYVQYKDAAGNISANYSSSINLDATAPIISASPVGGTFGSAQNVTLSANEQATIYYTTDGSTPTSASTVYSSQISINTSTTLKYIGIDAVGNQSAVQTESYTIDSGPPTGSITINGGAASTTTTSVTLTLTATDDSGTVSQMRFSNDNATWSAWEPYSTTKAWTLSSGSGTKTVYAEFKDANGNSSIIYLDSITMVGAGTDLIVSALNAPANALTGTSMPLVNTVTNQGAVTASSSAIKFYLSTDTVLDGSDVFLAARYLSSLAGGASSSATTSPTISVNTSAGTYYVIGKTDADENNAEADETNNTMVSGPVTITSGVDLVVSALNAASSVQTGTGLSVTNTVNNQGAGIAVSSMIGFYLSSDTVLDAADPLIGSRSMSSLSSGASSSGTNVLSIPVSTAAGTYYVIGKADYTNTNPESDETNNIMVSGPVTITSGVDLVVSALNAASSIQTGTGLSVTNTVNNQGGGIAVSSMIGFYLSSDTVLDAADPLIGSRSMNGLSSGASSSGTNVLSIPVSTAAGTYYVIGKADYTNTNPESDETNNTMVSEPVTITSGVDLVVSALNAPVNAITGTSMPVTNVVMNQGSGVASSSAIKLYLSTDTLLDGSDVFLAARYLSSLSTGASSSGTTSPTISVNTAAGSYYVIGKADADNNNPESDETNNIMVSGPVSLTSGIDLVVSAISMPASAQTGATIAVSSTVANNGTGTSTGSWLWFYLSADTVIDSSDAILGSRAVDNIVGGGSSIGTTNLTIPVNAASGSYYIIGRADVEDENPESNETNNIGVSSGTISIIQ